MKIIRTSSIISHNVKHKGTSYKRSLHVREGAPGLVTWIQHNTLILKDNKMFDELEKAFKDEKSKSAVPKKSDDVGGWVPPLAY